MNLEIYQKLCAESKILWTQHCLQRMQERDISRADVKNGIATGEIIEDYPDDFHGSKLPFHKGSCAMPDFFWLQNHYPYDSDCRNRSVFLPCKRRNTSRK